MNTHNDARLTAWGRAELVRRVYVDGEPPVSASDSDGSRRPWARGRAASASGRGTPAGGHRGPRPVRRRGLWKAAASPSSHPTHPSGPAVVVGRVQLITLHHPCDAPPRVNWNHPPCPLSPSLDPPNLRYIFATRPLLAAHRRLRTPGCRESPAGSDLPMRAHHPGALPPRKQEPLR